MGYWTPSMESCSSGEEVVVKARKPYTITKQRERWTEEEHNRFLEALKLYGRAWQRIEEHIGTKTAIQIRSHAQKFFTKLEKEALSKGIPLGQTLDIDIPPPRPKRKPSNPYPRKSGVVACSSTKEEKQDKLVVASQSQCPNVEVSESGKAASDAKPDRMGTLENATKARENGACTEVLPLFNDPLTSVNSKRNSGHPFVVGEFIPKPQKEKKGKTITNKMATASEENGESKHHTSDVGDANICRLEGRHINSQAKMAPLERLNKHKQPEKVETQSTNNTEHVEHVPMLPIHETKDGGEAACSDLRNTVPVPSINPQATQMNTDTLRNPSISTAPVHPTDSSVSFFHQLPSFPPFFLPQRQDAYQSVLNASSTFSNLIVSTLLQNPAAHAAATAAVSFWPPQDSDKSKDSIPETTNGTIPGGHVNPHPSMAAIAADTVAAATAWWAMHGLFPLCHPPFPTGFPFVSAATTTSPIVTASQVKENKERRNNLSRIHPEKDRSTLNSKLPEHLMLQCSASKSAPSSESDERREYKRPDGTNLKSSGTIKLASTRDATFRESNSKERTKKRKEDFCCDYGKHSGGDATDTIEEDLQGKEKQQEFLVHHTSTVETRLTRCRSSVNCVNESRKEGRLAFQALFSREELPQSFSPLPSKDGAIKQCSDLGAATPPVYLSNNSHTYSSENDHFSGSDDVHARNNDCLEKFSSTSEKGNLKPEAHRMGFKPYKRCSVEANVGRINSEEGKGGKRLHMEGKTSNL